jgi:prolyl-tRNA synthetase
MIRKVASGIYSYLPIGFRVLQKVEQIVREEMHRVGAQEVLLPFVQPSELWKESGRWEQYGKELLRLRDRHERNFCLGPTHEEVVTDLIRREVRSYRQLPINLFQIQLKFRDEIRPRFGLMRGREFIMKDGYSFDADEQGARIRYDQMVEAYHRVFARCGLRFRAVEADTGLIGGDLSHEFMVLAETGEEGIASCSRCSYTANLEKAISGGLPPGVHEEMKPLEKKNTPGKKSVQEVSSYLGVSPKRLVKTLLYRVDGTGLAVLVRGDHEVNEVKLKCFLRCQELGLGDSDWVEQVTGAPSGFSGPVGLKGIRIVVDLAVRQMVNFVAGGNQVDLHFVNVNWGRDVEVEEFCDLRIVQSGDPCPRCDGSLSLSRGIEVGHVFMLGDKYSKSMRATFQDQSGQEKPFVMGCYGIGIGRTIAASIEQNHDEKGIIWPEPLAPFQVHVIPVNDKSEKVMITAELIYGSLLKAGLDVLIDDREERAGVKFNDADLLGMPYQVVVGERNLEKGLVELKHRKSGEVKRVTAEEIIDIVKELFHRSPGIEGGKI